MTIHLQRDLESLRKDVLHLGSLVQGSTKASIDFLNSKKTQQLDEVAQLERRINELEVDIEEHCLKILALHQPVAIDLRFIVVVMKVNNDLERMGDQAVNIAHRVQALIGEPDLGLELPLNQMTDTIQQMVTLSLEALVNQDATIARRVVEMDGEVDDLHSENYAALRRLVENNPQRVGSAMSMATVSSNLERIGDLCTNIAEEVIFMVEGKVIRHQV
jgi:phosphate transport system protein